jgi:hypothetical protein
MNYPTRSRRTWRRLAACGLLGLSLLPCLAGCGIFMRPADPAGGTHWSPRPLQRMRAAQREKDLQKEIDKDKFPNAEQVGISSKSAAKGE